MCQCEHSNTKITGRALPQNLSPVNSGLAENVSRETEACLPPHPTHKGIVYIITGIRKRNLKYDAKGKGYKEKSQHQTNKNVNDLSRNTIKKIKEQRRECYMGERLHHCLEPSIYKSCKDQ